MSYLWTSISECLFGKYDYVKIKRLKHVISFAFRHNSIYYKFIIACHPDKCFNHRKPPMSYNEYYYFGDWHYYDGNSKKLYEQIEEFNPKPENLELMVNLIEAECNLKRYKHTCAIIGEWVQYVVGLIPKDFFAI